MVSESLRLVEGSGSVVIQKAEQGVQSFEHRRISALLDRVHWDDLHSMRAVADWSSFRKAALSQKLSLNTLRARVSRLEAAMNTIIFIRDRSGVRMTPEGRIVLQIASEMKQLSTNLPFGAGNNTLMREGEIRICASEGLGTFWLSPRLGGLKDALPDLLVSLDSFADQNRVNPSLYDISIGFSHPTDMDAIVSKVGTVHMMPFASEDYLTEFGEPLSLEEVLGHRCVQQEASGLRYDALSMFLGSERAEQVVSMQVNSSQSLFWAVAGGAGIGALPTYICSLSNQVRPITLPIRLKFDIWMSFNRSAKDSAPIRKAIDWVRSSFDASRYPWFADTFISPDRFGDYADTSAALPIFEQLIDDVP
jgi:DNA-binding transcriptional LysR family regulator